MDDHAQAPRGLRSVARGVVPALALMISGVLVPPAGAISDREPFDYYRFITERQPFGSVASRTPPPAANPEPVAETQPVKPTPPQPPPKWSVTLRLCAIIKEDDAPVRVGLYDQQSKQSYWINEGEAEEYFVVQADYDGERALIEKDGRRYWLPTEGDAYEEGAEPPPTSTISAAARSATPTARIGTTRGAATRARRAISEPALTKEEYEEIKHTLPPPVSPDLARARADGTAPPAMTPEELTRYLQAQQMELIRAQGELGPALPVPLTPEMDAQLVAEGVLPPQ